jgi:hypothetical protein
VIAPAICLLVVFYVTRKERERETAELREDSIRVAVAAT